MGTSLGFQDRNFVSSSNTGLVRSGRPGLRTSDVKSDFAALAHNSQLRRVNTFPSSESESTQDLGSSGFLADLLDFRMSSYGSLRTSGVNIRSKNPSDFAPSQAENSKLNRYSA